MSAGREQLEVGRAVVGLVAVHVVDVLVTAQAPAQQRFHHHPVDVAALPGEGDGGVAAAFSPPAFNPPEELADQPMAPAEACRYGAQ